MRRFTQWIAAHPKRFLALLFAPTLIALAGDALVGHAAGKDLEAPVQLAPVVLGTAGGLALLVAAPVFANVAFAWTARIVGAVQSLVGLIGTVLHVGEFLETLNKEPLTWSRFEDVIAGSPPLFAPGAFFAVGAAIFALGLSSWHLQIGPARD